MANPNLKKPIIELNKPGGKPIAYWESSKAAADFYNLSQVVISYNVNGKTRQAKGHYFRYATKKETEEYNNNLLRIDAADRAAALPVVEEPAKIDIPAEIIPDVVQKPEDQYDTLTPFEKMLQKSKNKLDNNSE